MAASITLVTLVVADQDAALDWFVNVLGFDLLEDTALGEGKRWIRVAPKGGRDGVQGPALLLAKAANAEQAVAIGRQAGGRVGFFLTTDDFPAEHAAMDARGVRFLEAPRREPYGWVCVFEDCCGNRWDLLGPVTA